MTAELPVAPEVESGAAPAQARQLAKAETAPGISASAAASQQPRTAATAPNNAFAALMAQAKTATRAQPAAAVASRSQPAVLCDDRSRASTLLPSLSVTHILVCGWAGRARQTAETVARPEADGQMLCEQSLWTRTGARQHRPGSDQHKLVTRDPKYRCDLAVSPRVCARHRAQYPDMYVDDRCVRFPDAYPKARHHALVVARHAQLNGPADLRRQHVPLLQHMQVCWAHTPRPIW